MVLDLVEQRHSRASELGGAASVPAISPERIERLLAAILAEELVRLRNAPVPAHVHNGWDRSTDLGPDGLGLDSLALLEVVARVNQMFGLHTTGVEDYMFVRPTLGDWTDLLAHHLEVRGTEATIAFQTSGSTGAPKQVCHDLLCLKAEVDALAPVLLPFDRVVTFVPPQHIYGFLWTVLMPSVLGIPVLDVSASGIGGATNDLRSGDLVIVTPVHLKLVQASSMVFPQDTRVVSSAGALPTDLWNDLIEQSQINLLEIFGSTETGGIGYRSKPDAPFTLLSHLSRMEDGIASARKVLPLQDRLDWTSDTSFLPSGRVDNALKVAGHKVYPDEIAARLEEDNDVADAVVRIDQTATVPRLKCLIVKQGDRVEDAELESRLRASLAHRPAPEQPISYHFSDRIPMNSMGKPVDW
ncbi:MAG: AMP-binding protein [Pseudomonadota bacterium]